MTAGNQRILSIQLLRALAALAVVWFHASTLLAARSGAFNSWSKLGSAGVDLFFIVSGFIMWLSAIDRDEGIREFAIKRVVRIVPLYWLTTAAVLVISLVAPGLMHNVSHTPAHYLAAFVFVAYPHPALPGRFWPPVIPGWTLNYEALFYVVVAISLALRRQWRAPFCTAVLVGLTLCHPLARPDRVVAFYTHPVLLEFVFGLLLGAARVRLSPVLALTSITCGMAWFLALGRWGTDANRVLTWGVPLTLLTMGAINTQSLGPAALRRAVTAVGDASYSLYLTQFLVLPPAAIITWWLLGGLRTTPTGAVMFVASLMVMATLTGLLSYHLIEKPVTKTTRRLLSRALETAATAQPPPPSLSLSPNSSQASG